MKTNNGKRLLAAVAIIAMVICAAACIMPSDVNGETPEAKENLPEAVNGTITLDGNYALTAGATLTDVTLDLAGFTLTYSGTITLMNSSIENGTVSGTTAQNNIISLNGNSSLDGVTIEDKNSEAGVMVDVAAGSNVTISDCVFVDGKDVTSVYINSAANAETSVEIDNCDLGVDDNYRCINWFGEGGNVTLNNNTGTQMQIDEGVKSVGSSIVISETPIGTFQINEKATVEVAENEVLSAENITGAGKLQVDEGGFVEGIVSLDKDNYTNKNVRVGLTGDMVNFGVDELPVSGNLYIVESLTINEGKTLIIQSGAVLDLNGQKITVEGTLVIEEGAEVINSADAGSIILSEGGVFNNNGTVGAGTIPVQVGVNDNSYVQMLNVSGITFTVNTNKSDDADNYTLQVSGQTYAADSGLSHKLTLNNVEIVGDMTIGANVDAKVTGTDYILDSANLTVDGSLDITTAGAVLKMKSGSAINVNGPVDGVITAETGKFQNVNADQTAGKATGTTTVNFHSKTDYITGVTLSVKSVGTFADVDGKRTAFTEQSLLVSGDADLLAANTASDKLSGMLAIVNSVEAGDVQAGISYIETGTTLSLAEGISVDGGNTTVLGTVQYAYDSKVSVTGFLGTERSVGTANERVVYITTFETAYNDIANAYDGLRVYGDLEINIDVDLQSKQKISFETSGVDITIDEQTEVTVNAGASIGKITTVDGILTKYNGANCPVPENYAVKKTGDGYTQYAGLKAALNNAVAGETIEVVNDCTVDGDLNVTDGVTLSVKSNVTVQIDGNLNIPETSKVTNNGAIQMIDERSKITVNGELDSSNGTVDFGTITDNSFVADANADSKKALTSAGTTTLKTTAGGNAINNASGATYADGTNTVITTLPKAAAAVAETTAGTITIIGNVTDKTDVTIPENVAIEFGNDAKAVLGVLTLSEGSTFNSENAAEVTATIAADVGATGSETTSIIDLAKASGISAGIVSYISADNSTTTYLVMSGEQAGDVTVSAGNVYVDGYTVNGCTLTVATGATLTAEIIGSSVDGTITVGENKDKAALVVDGTFSVNGGTIEAVTESTGEGTDAKTEIIQIIDVNGTMSIVGETTVDGRLNIGGSVEIVSNETTESVLNIGGQAYVNGSISGAVSTIDGYIVAYAGSDMTAADIDVVAGESAADSTQFYINGDLYMTAYTAGSVNIQDILTAEDFSMSGYVTKNDKVDIKKIESWFVDAEMSEPATDGVVGNPEALYFKASPAMVDVTISVGEGISLYIDGVRYQTGTQLSVGTHTVSANVNPGYKGDVTIQFNGQTVTGSFTITPEMASNAYEGTVSVSASGNITVDSSAVIVGGDSDDGMSLTDILLIVLVVLILVMAIIVALRLMRS